MEGMKEETFNNYIKAERDCFVIAVNTQEWNTALRTSAENILIAYDQLNDRNTLLEELIACYQERDELRKASFRLASGIHEATKVTILNEQLDINTKQIQSITSQLGLNK